MRTEGKRPGGNSAVKKDQKNVRHHSNQTPMKIFFIQMLFCIALLQCGKYVSNSNQETIESQSEVIGIWKPLKAELYRKGMNALDSTIDYSRHDFFYEFTKDSFYYIEPAPDTACYQQEAVLSSIADGFLICEGLEQPIKKVDDTLAITWTNDSIYDAIVFSIELSGSLTMGLCPESRQDTAIPDDDLPTHRKPGNSMFQKVKAWQK